MTSERVPVNVMVALFAPVPAVKVSPLVEARLKEPFDTESVICSLAPLASTSAMLIALPLAVEKVKALFSLVV